MSFPFLGSLSSSHKWESWTTSRVQMNLLSNEAQLLGYWLCVENSGVIASFFKKEFFNLFVIICHSHGKVKFMASLFYLLFLILYMYNPLYMENSVILSTLIVFLMLETRKWFSIPLIILNDTPHQSSTKIWDYRLCSWI